ncbi:MAG: hypothetical protein H0T42_05730 [Deltaproteobacteria bacterium]|nr:hypothetical protein [Deltaproteobacteria bacterium]
MRSVIAAALALAACACPNKPVVTPTTGGTGSGGGPVTATCDSVTPKVESLYRADGQTAEAIGDNTTMVIAACRRTPDKVSACIASATTVKDLETQCLPGLDEEGSEADGLVR